MPRPKMEEMAESRGVCEFCGARNTKRCDGKLPDGTVCSKKLCEQHAKVVMHAGIDGGQRLLTVRAWAITYGR